MKSLLKRKLIIGCAIFLAISSSIAGAQTDQRRQSEPNLQSEGQKTGESKKEKDHDRPREVDVGANTPVLWQDPGEIEHRDLFYGPGGQAGSPYPAGKFTYVRDQPTGFQKKIIVKDDQGRTWTVKFGPEARPETAASRIVWAVGYYVNRDYFVKEARIEGYSEPVIYNVRFERRDDGYKNIGNWSWKSNPFVGTRELDGLKTLMALINNWDLKELNNKVERPSTNGEQGRLIYYVADLGATFGRTRSGYGGIPFTGDVPADRGPGKQKAKGDPEAYASEKFISEKRNGQIKFYIRRTRVRHLLKDVSVENARWIGGLLARLSVEQLSDAFRAGGFSDIEVESFVNTIRKRIQELVDLKEVTQHSGAATGMFDLKFEI
jgi:hypothetical protein